MLEEPGPQTAFYMFPALFPQTKQQQSFHKQSDDALHRIVILSCNDTTG